MFEVQVYFDGKWVTVCSDVANRDDAWWLVSKWRRDNDCRKDGAFRVRLQEQDESDGLDLSKSDLSVEVSDAGQFALDEECRVAERERHQRE